ncbi:NADP-dependent sorbitol-6-phosphate dehydrogenase [Prunus yedoensis var. nudiflora]|uniref:NADP-dependent sorbitol-6-phosphate dehydrogenase n=1 Tax=Prunus yedoensis var. nudiflora TaxID=2094558 RepID=A0A314UQ70_PRUYE|nr:NADP-dependent sorbitol-6-phosphate dehydrogenase [Prunus yedoensis var. nudiflora]
MSTITLNNGFEMPVIGLGLWRLEKEELRNTILNAIKLGYRHFDAAAHYKTEVDVGNAIAEAIQSGLVKREELFITSKVWNSDHGHVVEACKNSLKKLQLDYLDLYLVHYPLATKHNGVGATASLLDENKVLDIDVTVSLETTWHDMEKTVSLGLVRSIGLSNYELFLTRDCLSYAKIKPQVSQFETHPYFQRESLVRFCKKHGVIPMAHTPLGGATANVKAFGSISPLEDPVLLALAKKYQKSVAQIALRWNLERDTPVIPKSSKVERLKENLEVLNFKLEKEDIELINTIDKKFRTTLPSLSWGVDVYA